MPPKHPSTVRHIMNRLERKTIVADNGCWLFTGGMDSKGYGLIALRTGRRMERVHRLSAHFFLGYDFNSSLWVLHKVNCPNRNCWNPEHLYIGTPIDNVRDCIMLEKSGSLFKRKL